MIEFMYGDVIGISYLIDPVQLGKDMLDEHKIRVEYSLFEAVSLYEEFFLLKKFLEELFLPMRIENSTRQRRSNCLLSTPIGSL